MSDPDFLANIQKIEADLAQAKGLIVQGASLGNWWTWTQAQFQTWLDANLMTDAQIDGTAGLSAALKTNLKANNLAIRNMIAVLVVARDIIKWLVRNI